MVAIVTIRCPFGIASGPEEYQWRQHEFLDGLNGVINIADDICVYGCGETKEEADIDHDRNLTHLREKCNEHDLQLSARKIQFKSIQALSHLWGTDLHVPTTGFSLI